jgi:5'-3' exonuclease
MGVPGLFSFLNKRYDTPFNNLANTSSNVPDSITVHNLLIDGNALLHPVARGYYFAKVVQPKVRKTGNNHVITPKITPPLKTDKECFRLISEAVVTIIMRSHPIKKVVFGVDGSVPFAKSAEQRKRRFGAISQSSDLDPNAFNTSQISVATPWMVKLHKFLLNEVRHWAILFPGVEIVYESYLVPGECEHRLVDMIRNGPIDQTYMVHGSDADIISLLLLCWNHYTYILRDRVDGKIDECCVIDIPVLRRKLISDYLPEIRYRGKDKRELIVVDHERLNSIVFIWYLVGMDFLPRCPSLEIFNGGMDFIAQTMYEVMSKFGSFVKNIKTQENPEYVINKQALIIWLKTVGKYDSELINKKAKAKCLVPDSILERHTVLGTDCNPHVNVESYKQDYNSSKFPNTGDLQKACKSYLDGLQWTFLYYTNGVPSWTWHYPYHYSPWVDDLATALASPEYSFPKFTRDKSEPFPEHMQLLFILPPQSFHLLPEPLRCIKDELPEMFPESIETDEEGIQREWEAKSLAPFVDWKIVKEKYFEHFPYTISRDNASLIVTCKNYL